MKMNLDLEGITADPNQDRPNTKFVLKCKPEVYYKGLRADPDNPIIETDSKNIARQWNTFSGAKSFLEDNSLTKYGFYVKKIMTNK